jgi:uncharacterized RDD family membrane protein YckC
VFVVDNATFGQRLVAIIIDHIILFIIAMIIAIPIGIQAAFFSFGTIDPAFWASIGIYSAVNFIIWIVYFTYFEGKSGDTIGKRAMGIKVVAEKGKMDYSKAFIRSILRIVDFLPIVYILGFIVAIASKKKQRIGDLAARTLVVKA